MKKTITTISFLLVTVITLFAQEKPQQEQQISNNELATQYLNKSKNQKKISTILLVSGGALILTGMIVSVSSFGNSFDFSHPESGSAGIDAGGVLAISGTCVLVTGIPFAFAARHNKKKAELLLKDEKIIPSTSFASGRVYSIGVAINF